MGTAILNRAQRADRVTKHNKSLIQNRAREHRRLFELVHPGELIPAIPKPGFNVKGSRCHAGTLREATKQTMPVSTDCVRTLPGYLSADKYCWGASCMRARSQHLYLFRTA